MKHATSIALAASIWAMGCLPVAEPVADDGVGDGAEDGSVVRPPTDSGDDATALPSFSITGTYQGTQRWNLSELLTFGDDGGDAVADATISAIVGLTGLPSFLRDDAEGVVADLVGDQIADYADAALGEATVLDELAGVLGTARVGTRLTIESHQGSAVAGKEELTLVTLRHGDTEVEVPVADVVSVLGYDVVIADVDGELSPARDAVELGSHSYVLRSESIIAIAGVEVLGYDTLEAALSTIVDCDQLIARVTGAGGELSFSVASYDIALSAEQLAPVCEAAKEELVDYVLGYFEMDIPVAASGVLALTVNEGTVSRLTGRDYRGVLSALPLALGFGIEYDVARAQ